ncbi:MAG: hypothetical protein HY814_09340 [Candidatus Riflebacteria bacterium]|nr:hypothetical protein [Candidatus Riflebacteria bacterium]
MDLSDGTELHAKSQPFPDRRLEIVRQVLPDGDDQGNDGDVENNVGDQSLLKAQTS